MIVGDLTLPATLEHLTKMLSFIKEKVKELGFPESEAAKIELACEEALVNIINYAYPTSQSGSITIECSEFKIRGIQITLRDQGIPFEPRIPDDKESLGGRGIMLINKIMDEVKYSRKNKTNILVLIKYLR